jgi:hypothetical protein
VSGAVDKMVSKGGRIRAAFFYRRQKLLSYRTSESSVFSIQGGGVRGGPRGGPGGPKTKCIKIYEYPKRPHNSGFWIGMTPRDDRDGRGGGPGGQKIDSKDEIKKRPLTCKNFVRRDFFSDGFDRYFGSDF